MVEQIRFVSNYSDQSTDRGFQFEFQCDRCGTGYRTPFKTWTTGTVTSALETAGDLFGGVLSRGYGLSHRIRSAGWQKARDDAFKQAVNEVLKPLLHWQSPLPDHFRSLCTLVNQENIHQSLRHLMVLKQLNTLIFS